MGRQRKQEEVKEGLPMWMGTFSDLVTLMMAFFVMLVAMASFEDTKRIEAVIESIHAALGVTGFDSDMIAIHSEKKHTTESVLREETIQPVVSKIREAFKEKVSDSFIELVKDEQETRIRIDGGVFFQPGSATIHPAGYAVISKVAKAVAGENVRVRVEGFADGTGTELANWQLSSERALAVVLAFREKGPIAGERLEMVAHGSFHKSAKSAESSDWSRRVEILLITKDVAGARTANDLGQAAKAE